MTGDPFERPLRVAVIGYGYWGPNLVRNVVESRSLELACLCERDPERAQEFRRRVRGVPVVESVDAVTADDGVDAVIVATPPRSHHSITREALLAGKHALVEKPLARSVAEAGELVELASERDLVLMPGHTFLYSPPVNKIKELIDGGALGDIYFVTSSRMNLGKYQADGVVCDLAPHDLSILLYLLGEAPVEVSASARSVFQEGVPEAAFLTLHFESGTTANVQISWLAPRKVREMLIVGSEQMVQYDDTAADEAVRVYDRGMDLETPTTFGEHQLAYRSGDIVVPRIDAAEPLALELEDFACAVRTGTRPRSDAELGFAIVAAVQAAECSLAGRSERVAVEQAPPALHVVR